MKRILYSSITLLLTTTALTQTLQDSLSAFIDSTCLQLYTDVIINGRSWQMLDLYPGIVYTDPDGSSVCITPQGDTCLLVGGNMEIINTDTHLAWEGNILEYVNDGHDEEIGIICPDHAIFAMQIVRAMFEPPD